MKKIKLYILTFVMLMTFGIINVNAGVTEILEELIPDNKLHLDLVAPKNAAEMDFYYSAIANLFKEKYDEKIIIIDVGPCDETFTTCTLNLNDIVAQEAGGVDVEVIWHTPNPLVKTKIDGYAKQITDKIGIDKEGWPIPYYVYLTDMNLVNYYVSANSKEMDNTIINSTIAYSETLRKTFGGANMSYSIDMRKGNTAPFYTYGIGGFFFHYNNVIYKVIEEVGIKFIEAIYVPNDTELTDNALIAAASKRIKDYLPNSNITITAGELLTSEEFGYADFSTLVDLTKTTNKTYVVNFGSFSVPFLIVTDSTKMINPKFESNDIDTSVGVTSNESSIPLDTVVNVNELDKDGEVYKKLLEQVGTDKMASYDLALFSKTKNENITKLDNGKFLVSIPIPSNLEGKNLIVYYINAKGEKEAHEVTIKNGMASFETNHFSIYNLTENLSVPNPQTFDGITVYIILGIISLLGISYSTIYLRKKTN